MINQENDIQTQSFSIVKEKIIKTDELLLLFKEKNDKLGKATQAFKNLKVKYETANNEINGLKMESERLNFTIQTIKPEYEKQNKELLQTKTELDNLNEKYQQTMIESQLTIGDLEQSLNNCVCEKNDTTSPAKSNNSSLKVKELKKLCDELKHQEKDLRMENVTLLSRNAELESRNVQISKNFENLKSQNMALQTEIVSLKNKISKIEISAMQQQKCLDSGEMIKGQFGDEIRSLKVEISKLTHCRKKCEILEHDYNLMKKQLYNLQRHKREMKHIEIQTMEAFGEFNIRNSLIGKEKTDFAVQVDWNEDYQMGNTLSIHDIFEEMILPKAVSPLYFSSPMEDKLFAKEKCESIALTDENIELDIDKNIPNIVITPPTPCVEKTNKLETELFKSAGNPDAINNLEMEKAHENQLGSKNECETKNTEVSNTSLVVNSAENDLLIAKCASDSSIGDVMDCNSIVTKKNLRKEKVRRLKKFLFPFNCQPFVKSKIRRRPVLKSVNKQTSQNIEQGGDIILKALRSLQENNIAFTISNESFPNIESNQNCLPQVLTTASTDNIFSQEISCWNKNCSKVKNMLLRKSGESEPELLGFFNDKFDVSHPCNINTKTSQNYSHTGYLIEQLVMSIKELVQNQDKKSYESYRKKRSRLKSDPSNFYSETETELERLFSSSSDILDRNKRLLAAAKKTHLGSTGESVFESESDIMVDSGLVTASSCSMQTAEEIACSINSFEKHLNTSEDKKVISLNNVHCSNCHDIKNTTGKHLIDKCSNRLSPITSSKGSPEESYKFMNPNTSPIFTTYPVVSPLSSSKDSLIKNYSKVKPCVDTQHFSREIYLNNSIPEEKYNNIENEKCAINSPDVSQPLTDFSESKLKVLDYFLPSRKALDEAQNSLLSVHKLEKLKQEKSEDDLSINLSVGTSDLNCSLTDIHVSQLLIDSPSLQEAERSSENTAIKTNVLTPTRHWTRSQNKKENFESKNSTEVSEGDYSSRTRAVKRKLKVPDIKKGDSLKWSKLQACTEEVVPKRKRGRPKKIQKVDLEALGMKDEKPKQTTAYYPIGTSNISEMDNTDNNKQDNINTGKHEVNHMKMEEIPNKQIVPIIESINYISDSVNTEVDLPCENKMVYSNANSHHLVEDDLFGDISDLDDENEKEISRKSVKRKSERILLKKTLLNDLGTIFPIKYNKGVNSTSDKPTNTKNEKGKVNIIEDILVSNFRVTKNAFNSRDKVTTYFENSIDNNSVDTSFEVQNSTEVRQIKNSLIDLNLIENDTYFSKAVSTKDKLKTNFTGKKKIKVNDVKHTSTVDILSQVIKCIEKTRPKPQRRFRKNCNSLKNNPVYTPLTVTAAIPISTEQIVSQAITGANEIPDCPPSSEVRLMKNSHTDLNMIKDETHFSKAFSTKDELKIDFIGKKKIKVNVVKNTSTPVDILSQVMECMVKTGPKPLVPFKKNCGTLRNNSFYNPLISTEQVVSQAITGPKESPDSPQSPEHVEVPDQIPKLIPTNKPLKLPASKVKILIDRLMIYSNEEIILDEIIYEFAFQDKKYMIEIILEKLSLDYHEKADNSTPPSPIMTSTQRILLGFLSKLDQSTHPGILVDFLGAAEEKLFKKNSCNILILQPITRFYAAICKLRRDLNRMRRFVCEAFYFVGDFAPPMFFIILTIWADVLPMAAETSDNITAKVLVQLCHLKGCNKPGYNFFPLKDLLNKYFGYPTERWKCDDIFRDILVEYRRYPSKRLFSYTLLLFLRNKPANWVHNKIKQTLIPLYEQIPDSNVNLKANLLILLANICSGFDKYKEQDWAVILELDNWFQGKESDDSDAIIKRSIIYARGVLPRKPHHLYKKTIKQLKVETERSKNDEQ